MSDYNGWKNYETWNVALWLGNDPVTDETARDIATSGTINEGAEGLKDWVNDMMPDLGASMFSDLLGAALSEVDWYEIAEHYCEDAQ